ncbi:ribosomal uS15-like protein [Fragilaria crotonensis]|nr:ribosomal uS15-like protein [Fragilaria crotonensis]
MAVSKNTLLAVLLLALNNNVAAFVPVTPRATQLSRQQAPLPVALDIDEVSAEDDSIPPEDYIVNVGDLESEDDEDGISDDGEPPSWYASAERIAALRLEHRRHEGDTGSPEYQIAGMTERINYLTSHLKLHPKDFSTRRGLVALVNKRRRLLNYLYKQNADGYKAVIASLGIRHKVPGQVEDRNEKFNRFPSQKAVKKHLIKKK